ncbi:DMT superfamily permease [Novosphingobium sp. Rr 2-17]|uniref:EamA family transporter n=1 Tax=Novosphingobium sp. Rr 2-17 TaxID=555793 RepID=UPI0002697B38|nr:EamA family transporter [Novosphingobium sp. Rr 2-17]EIZ80225.1 DMT superfamily permease [Novosphingobium sp. Rr 2-17]
MTLQYLWVPITLAASALQVVRNGAQAGLTAKIGTLGATQVRFVYGFPFALIFFLLGLAWTGEPIPHVTSEALAWCLTGAMAQIAATALMLLVMRDRAFGVAYAYIKTEPVIVALFGALFLGDLLPLAGWLAVVIVTGGVLLVAIRPGEFRKLFTEARPALTGVAAGGLFGFAVVAFRGSIMSFETGGFIVRSLTVLVLCLAMQTLLLGGWLALRDRASFTASLREWRGSLGAGLAGSAASACWLAASALTAAANVRTLALVEMPIAALASWHISRKRLRGHELAGFALVLGGVALLLAVIPPDAGFVSRASGLTGATRGLFRPP